MNITCPTRLLSLIIPLLVAIPASQAQRPAGSGNSAGGGDSRVSVLEQNDGSIVASDPTGTYLYASWNVYFASPFFMRNRMRCGQPFLPSNDGGQQTYGSKNDCAYGSTNPKTEYDPAVQKFSIPVVVHILMHTNGNGAVSDAMVQSQIDILNEDFMALPGTNGSPGTDCQVDFYLATVDPNGNATTGITRDTNNNWYNDSGNFKSALAWNTNKYFNIYTNTASGYLGYAYLPQQGGIVGNSIDGVVCHWRAFGRNSPFGPPYNQGRTTTHEAGHYLGLWHTFDFGCGSTSSCYSTGDTICDTNRESGPVYGCPGNSNTCSSQDPFHNYMDYTDDLCMWEFTSEQARRLRCTVEYWRPDLFTSGGGSTLIFGDDFESGDYAAGGWVTQNGKCRIHKKSAYSGTWGARLKRLTNVQKTFSTVGFSQVRVNYAAKVSNYTGNKKLILQWFDGSSWVTVDKVQSSTFANQSVFLPAGAENNPNCSIRFKSKDKTKGTFASFDDVAVWGD